MPIELLDFFPPRAIEVGFDAQHGEEVLHHLAELMAGGANPAAESLEQKLIERETLGSTALGSGVALPHARVPGLERIVCALVVTREGVSFDEPDGRPVRIFVGLLSPENTWGLHASALARLASILKNERLRQALLLAPDATAAREAIQIAEHLHDEERYRASPHA